MHTFLLNNNNPALVRNNMVIVVHLQEDVSKTLFLDTVLLSNLLWIAPYMWNKMRNCKRQAELNHVHINGTDTLHD